MSKFLNFKHITVASYSHPELYPPIISALDQLSQITGKIDVVTRNMLHSEWEYPKNVNIHYVGSEQYTGFEIEKIPIWLKLVHFYKFVNTLKKTVQQHPSDILIVHDVIPLFAAYLIKKTLKKQNVKLWYHNHDVTDITKAGSYSLMGIASKFEKNAFKFIDIFTLPSKERLRYFPIKDLKRPPIILPNYPLQSFYSKASDINLESKNETLKLVFQGSIGEGHGLEEIIDILDKKIHGKSLELHLVGKVRDSYLTKIEALVTSKDVKSQFKYHGMKTFSKLPIILSQFDIGIAIHKPYNVTYSTGGTASNKIYEYAASAMPVLLFDNAHYRYYLEKRNWTFFTDLTKQSLVKEMETIDEYLSQYSKEAYADFQEEFNFEKIFASRLLPILNQI